jgi:S-DNA-T family DNA segregation ATPase FtsK/SpoIIIE
MASHFRHPGSGSAGPADDFWRARRRRGIVSAACAAAALFYLLALGSFVPEDLPSWMPLAREAGEPHETRNDLGTLGALAAGIGLASFGVAAYLIPAVLLWYAVATGWGLAVWRLQAYVAGVLFLVSAACLVEFQPVFFRDWVTRCNLPPSPGGWAGWIVGHHFAVKFLGPVGSSALMLGLQVAGWVGLAGFRPFRFGHADGAGDPYPDGVHAPVPVGGAVPVAVARMERPLLESPRPVPVPPRTVRVIELDADPDDVELVPPGLPECCGPGGSGGDRRRPPCIDAEESPAHDGSEDEDDEDAAWEEPFRREETVLRKGSGSGERTGQEPVRPAPQVYDTVRPRKARRDGRPVMSEAGPVPRSFGTGRGCRDYALPSIDLLDCEEEKSVAEVVDTSDLLETQRVIIETLRTFGLTVSPGDITRGPTITRYEIYPSVGQSVKRIAALEADLARATRAERINILAPIPGRDTVGIEIANHKKVLVPLRELLEDPRFTDGKAQIPLALGKDVYGEPLVADLAAMPHLLVAGATGSGKSVCINSIIVSLLCRFTPEELRFIMIDPKVVEMQMYKDLPHLAVPVVTSPKKVLLALRWCINEMERRYELFAEAGCRKLEEYNNRHLRQQRRARRSGTVQPELFPRDEIGGRGAPAPLPAYEPPGEDGDEDAGSKLPFIVVIIDELADLMQTAPAEVETAISRLCQKARAAGIHLIVATQSPRVDVVTGLIKANIPSRIAFQVASATDSRVILDRAGADRLVGKGDMLYQPPDSPVMVRAQGAFVTDDEVQDIVEHCASQAAPVFDRSIQENLDGGEEEDGEGGVSDADEEILDKCIEVILAERKASTSFLQRRLRLGYTRAARMMDILEERGIVGPGDGAKPREILIAPDEEVA